MAAVMPYQLTDGSTRYKVRYYTPERKQTDRRGFKTKRDAAAFVATLTTALGNGSYVAPTAGRITVAEVAAITAAHKVRVKKSTVAKDESTWSTHLVARWGAVSVADIGTLAVKSWVASMAKAGAGPATIEAAFGMLRQILDTAVEMKAIAVNPAIGAKVPRRGHSQRAYLTHDQVVDLAQEVVRHTPPKGSVTLWPQYATVVQVLAYTGLRFGEMAALSVGSVNLQRNRLSVTRAVADVKGQLVWSTPKGHEIRAVPFPELLLGEQLRQLCHGRHPDDGLFVGIRGATLRPNQFLADELKPAIARLQARDPYFPSPTTHDLRHTAASLAISDGANVKAVQRMLGHKSAAMTLDTYADLFADDLDEVGVAMGRAGLEAAASRAPKMPPSD